MMMMGWDTEFGHRTEYITKSGMIPWDVVM